MTIPLPEETRKTDETSAWSRASRKAVREGYSAPTPQTPDSVQESDAGFLPGAVPRDKDRVITLLSGIFGVLFLIVVGLEVIFAIANAWFNQDFDVLGSDNVMAMVFFGTGTAIFSVIRSYRAIQNL